MQQITKRQLSIGLFYLLAIHLTLLPPLVFSLVENFFPGPNLNPIFQFILILVTTCFYIFLLRRPLGEGLRTLGKLTPTLLWAIPVGYVVTLLLRALVTFLIVMVYGDFNFGTNQETVEAVAAQAPMLIAFMAIVLAPLWEELFFTGLLFGGLRQKSRFLAYLAAPLAFGLLHTWVMFMDGFSLLTVLITLIYVPSAFVSCRLYEKTGNIWSSILFHSFSNALAVLVMTMF